MKVERRGFVAVVTFFAAVSIAAAAVALTDAGEGGDDGSRVSRDPNGSGESDNSGTNVAPVCAPEVPHCDDMIVNPDGDVGADPDEPVGSEPPATVEPPSACTMEYPNQCMSSRLAIADLAHRLDVSEKQITVKSTEFVEWPDSCLGIARPGVACAQVITPGYRILLEASGQAYEYHTNGEGSRAVLVE